jgi:hypothetical protein
MEENCPDHVEDDMEDMEEEEEIQGDGSRVIDLLAERIQKVSATTSVHTLGQIFKPIADVSCFQKLEIQNI